MADLPKVALEVFGNPSVVLNKKTVQGTSEEFFSTTLERDTDRTTKTDSDTDRNTVEHSEKWNIGAEANPLKLASSLSVNGGFESSTTDTFVSETQTTIETESVQETAREFGEARKSDTQVEFADGTLSVAFRVRNTGNRSYEVSDLTILAFRLVPGSSGNFAVVGQLEPANAADLKVVLGPGSKFTFLAQNEQLPADVVIPLLENPSALFFEVANFTIKEVDAAGQPTRDVGAVAGRVLERTARVLIDYGDGRAETHSVATNVLRNPDGTPAGLPMGEALTDILRIPFQTAQNAAGVEVLTQVRDRAQFVNEPPAARLD